ncbi:MAG: MFS transporter [Anaerolineales bacterium]|nr:MFS transporter [Chloroflexota bacterium]MBL6982220.1 MFS transporter [Anaerolineales bacterium]
MTLLLDALFMAVGLGHLIVDVLNGHRSILLTYLSGPLGLSNANLGMISMVYTVLASLLQPLFGYLVDRRGPRWVAAGGVLWMALFYSLAMITPGFPAIYLLIIASMGSGAFHPAGTMLATLRGRNQPTGREITSTAYFFFFGQFGLFVGPIMAGLLLERFGVMGLLITASLAWPVGVYLARKLRAVLPSQQPNTEPVANHPKTTTLKYSLGGLTAFALLVALRSSAESNMNVFMPKYLSDLGQSPSKYGLVTALFMGGVAFGNLIGGRLADQYGKRRVATLSLLLASIPLFIFPFVGWSPWLYLLVPLAGALSGASHSILVVIAQRMFPGRMALASGLILGFMFSTGALGTLVSGYLADLWGFPLVFQLTAVGVIIAAVLASRLQET